MFVDSRGWEGGPRGGGGVGFEKNKLDEVQGGYDIFAHKGRGVG